MSPQQPRYSAEETARRGDEIYEREVRARVEAGNHGKVVAIDIETGAYFRATLLLILITFGSAAQLDRSVGLLSRAGAVEGA